MRVVPALLLLAACAGNNTDCTAEIVASTHVLVTDETGAAADARVVWSANGGDQKPCTPGAAGEFLCGDDVAGEITISASMAGYVSQDQTVTVGEDACHVITEEVAIQLAPIDCPDVVLTSVNVRVVDEASAFLATATVTLSDRDDANAEACPVDTDAEVYRCGEDRAGALRVSARATGYRDNVEDVDVPTDECGIVTQSITLAMVPG